MKTLTAAQLKRQLLIGLKELRLPAMRALHREQADLARKQSLSYEHFRDRTNSSWELESCCGGGP